MTLAVNIAQSGANNVTMRNRIINGAMVISQRGTSFASPTNGDYTLDRWRNFQFGGGTYSVSQSSTVPNATFKNSALLTVTAVDSSIAAGDYYAYNQYIEGLNTYDFGWGSAGASAVTLSFWVRSSVTGLYAVALYNNAGDRGYPATFTISAANTWQQVTLTIPGCTDGTWTTDNTAGVTVRFDLGSGSSANGTANTWNSGGSFAASRTSSTVNWIANSGATFYITGVQLERGTAATAFEQRLYGTELNLCQRYYYRVTSPSTWGLAMINSSSVARVFTPFPVTMRTAPTAVEQNGTAGNYGIASAGANPASTSVPTFWQGDTLSAVTNFNTSGLTAGQSGLSYNAGGTPYLGWSAEL